MVTPNRILLISHGRREEYVTNADTYPGHILLRQSTGKAIPHNVVGGGGALIVAIEDALQGGDITQKIPSGQIVQAQLPVKGDLLLFLLAIGQNVANGAKLMSAGDGTLTAFPGTVGGAELYQILAPSTTITNTTAETAFSNGSYSIVANTLQAGDVIRIHTKAFCIAENSTNTHRFKLYVGSTVLADSTALQFAAGDVAIFDVEMTIRTIGASGTFVADGVVRTSVAGTFTTTPFTIVSTALDTTGALVLAIKSTASAASAGNQVRLDEMQVTLDRAGLAGQTVFVEAAEAIDNSAGSAAAFIRGLVI